MIEQAQESEALAPILELLAESQPRRQSCFSAPGAVTAIACSVLLYGLGTMIFPKFSYISTGAFPGEPLLFPAAGAGLALLVLVIAAWLPARFAASWLRFLPLIGDGRRAEQARLRSQLLQAAFTMKMDAGEAFNWAARALPKFQQEKLSTIANSRKQGADWAAEYAAQFRCSAPEKWGLKQATLAVRPAEGASFAQKLWHTVASAGENAWPGQHDCPRPHFLRHPWAMSRMSY